MGRPKKLRWKEGDWNVDNPGLFTVDQAKLRRLWPSYYGFRAWCRQIIANRRNDMTWRDVIVEQLWLGSIQAAVVVSMKPGRVAAYSDMLDCVAMLGYTTEFLQDFGLREGSKLLTVNYYDEEPHKDIEFGPGKNSSWKGFLPVIADFLTKDFDRLEERKSALPERYWLRVKELGYDYQSRRPDMWRSGRPRSMSLRLDAG